jgi:general secretion pathway protein C
MINPLKLFSTKYHGNNFELPKSRTLSFPVYLLLGVVSGIGVYFTMFHFMEKQVISSVAVAPWVSSKPSQSFHFDAILSRNIFNIEGTLPDSSNESKMYCSPDLKKSSLAYKVTGIIFGGSSRGSVALMETNGSSQLYKLGDKVVDQTVISDITKNKVFLKGKGCPEYLELEFPQLARDPRKGTAKSGSKASYVEAGFERVGNTTTATKQWVNDILTNKLSTVLEDARAVPFIEGGAIKGFTLLEVSQGSVYEKLGLKNGDVVASINGVELNDAARAIQTLNALRNESKIELSVLRGGQATTLKVNIQ